MVVSSSNRLTREERQATVKTRKNKKIGIQSPKNKYELCRAAVPPQGHRVAVESGGAASRGTANPARKRTKPAADAARSAQRGRGGSKCNVTESNASARQPSPRKGLLPGRPWPARHGSPAAGCRKIASPLVVPGNQRGRPPAPARGPQRPPHRDRHLPRCISLRGHRALPLTHPEDPSSSIAAPRSTAQLRTAPTTRLRYSTAASPLLASDRVPLSRPPPAGNAALLGAFHWTHRLLARPPRSPSLSLQPQPGAVLWRLRNSLGSHRPLHTHHRAGGLNPSLTKNTLTAAATRFYFIIWKK